MAPRRIQLRRAAGWRKPEGAVVVARPTRWGNPFRIEPKLGHDRDWAVASFRAFLADPESADLDYPSRDEIRAELAGKDLACWCPLSGPCHADVLLEIANGTD
ncbi:DUF4326 domain-containing protein [Microlunatus parietis]|uniref:DUF4326 domain-containing protein n=1 Tax=Microlunatus parietis TaxID=682979 RepID=A0A7Y9IAV6_9ACTN|nr:DUF4326 domain-containing protein [Microlunatus parietis]NYE73437.1 hypothetical protein [Microlunatus parietis]